jgi:hypothetical protein
MPLATEKLRRRSSKEAIQAAISACIETLEKENERRPEGKKRSHEQIQAICYADARRHAGGSKVPAK